MADQAEELRRLVRVRQRLMGGPGNGVGKRFRASLIAVASGKGGVGKSNIALNLALSLARRDFKVVLVDADFGAANICVLCGSQTPYTLHDVVTGKRELKDIIVEGPHGLRIVPGAAGMADLADLDASQRFQLVNSFKKLERQADLVLIDTGAGISKNVTDIVAGVDQVLVVTVPENIAIADAYSLVKAMVAMDRAPRIRLVVNRARSEHEADDVLSNLHAVARRFLDYEIQSLGWLPEDSHLEYAVRQRVPVTVKYPYSPVSRGIKRLVDPFVNGLEFALDRQEEKTGILGFLQRCYRGISGVLNRPASNKRFDSDLQQGSSGRK